MAPVPGSPWKCVSRMTSLPPSPHTHKYTAAAGMPVGGGNHEALNRCEGSLPRPPREGRDPSLVNLLTFLAMVVYVHDEVRKAVWLSYVAAAYSGILPSFYQTSASSGACPTAQLRLWHKLCIIAAPVLQFVTACTVLVSSLALTFTHETQTSIVTIILSNVALSFIVDLDNRIGGMLASQEQVTSYATATESGVQPVCTDGVSDDSTHGPPGNCVNGREGNGVGSVCVDILGYCYMSLIGALLLLEPVLLSSNVVEAIVDLRLPHEVWFVLVFLKGAHKLLYKLPSQLQLSVVETMWITVLPTALAIWLFFGTIMPVAKSKWWGRTLLVVQLSLFALSSFFPAYWFVLFKYPQALHLGVANLKAFAGPGVSFMFPFVWSVAWATMFVLWPLLHSWRDSRRQPKCGGGDEHRKLDQHTDAYDDADSHPEEKV